MVKIIYRSLKRTSASQPRSVKTKRVRDSEGRWVTRYSVDPDSPDFAAGIAYVFKKNVARARAAHKRRAASPEPRPAKS